jgi:hypothetical protein
MTTGHCPYHKYIALRGYRPGWVEARGWEIVPRELSFKLAHNAVRHIVITQYERSNPIVEEVSH